MRLTVALHLYQNDLPDDLDLGPIVAVDCETMGLNPARDRLCLVQLSSGDGHAHLVQVAKGQTEAPNLVQMIKFAFCNRVVTTATCWTLP